MVPTKEPRNSPRRVPRNGTHKSTHETHPQNAHTWFQPRGLSGPPTGGLRQLPRKVPRRVPRKYPVVTQDPPSRSPHTNRGPVFRGVHPGGRCSGGFTQEKFAQGRVQGGFPHGGLTRGACTTRLKICSGKWPFQILPTRRRGRGGNPHSWCDHEKERKKDPPSRSKKKKALLIPSRPLPPASRVVLPLPCGLPALPRLPADFSRPPPGAALPYRPPPPPLPAAC